MLLITKKMYTLKLKIVNDNGFLSTLYKKQIEKVNYNLENNNNPDSGFDIYIQKEIEFPFTNRVIQTKKIDFHIQCAMYDVHGRPSAFYIYPRSSISKSQFRLANNTGIIDSGYRGNLAGYFDCFSSSTETIEKGSRLVQICTSDLSPFNYKLTNKLAETERGECGFGSTGI